jgi:putative aminopeptidase FrvX
MKNKLNPSYMLKMLEQLLETPSPSGYCRKIMTKVEQEALRLGYIFERTPKGDGIITVLGKNTEVIGMSAHVDTLGAMVRSIKPNGVLRMTPIGGYMMHSVEGEYCLIHTREGRAYEGTVLTTQPSVHVYKDARDLKREEANMEIRIDERVRSNQDVLNLGIAVGDFISFDPRTKILENGFIKSRHLDDKASVAAIFGVLEMLQRERLTPSSTVKVIITTYEEVGHGASYIPPGITEFIAVDMGATGDDLTSGEFDVSICAKDSSGPYDYEMVGKLIGLAMREKLSYAVDVYPHYASDASAALKAGANIRAALIGPTVHASHGMERTHTEAVVNTASLLAAYILE